MKKYLLALVAIVIILMMVVVAKFSNEDKADVVNDVASSTTPVVCMEEAIQCPDGSMVERGGPNCDFAPCPTVPIKKDCPQLAPIGPNFCPNGKIESGGVGADGCQLPPKCVVETPVNDCVVGGCSGTLCGGPGEDLVSTCEYKEEYACYKQAVCERQTTGKCGWTKTPEFNACMIKY